MTAKETAKYLNVSTQTIYVLCRAGKIKHYRLGLNGGKVEIDQCDADAYRQSCMMGGATKTTEEKPKVRAYVPEFFVR